ncbi:MAG: hypothetical protein RL358_1292 [Pseudomonadota bacterium]|jgi:hypothetical protein
MGNKRNLKVVKQQKAVVGNANHSVNTHPKMVGIKIGIDHIKTVDSIVENLIAGVVAGLVIDLHFPVIGWIMRAELLICFVVLYAGSIFLKKKGGM